MQVFFPKPVIGFSMRGRTTSSTAPRPKALKEIRPKGSIKGTLKSFEQQGTCTKSFYPDFSDPRPCMLPCSQGPETNENIQEKWQSVLSLSWWFTVLVLAWILILPPQSPRFPTPQDNSSALLLSFLHQQNSSGQRCPSIWDGRIEIWILGWNMDPKYISIGINRRF